MRRHECDAADSTRETKGIDGHPAIAGAREDSGGVAFYGERIEGTGGNVEIGVGG